MIAFASSLDQAGVLAQSAEDAALLLGAMAGFDPRDSTSVDTPVPDYAAALEQPGRRACASACIREYFGEGLEAETRRARCARRCDVFEKLGRDSSSR